LKQGALYRESDMSCLVPRMCRAETAWERMRGLLGRQPLWVDQGLWIDSCSMVHTVGMSYAIDLLFLSYQGSVVKLVRSVPPWRCVGAFGAQSTIEICAGTVDHLQISLGDSVIWSQVQ
jgi:uncharacterized membrane protein (UPF0127 family)